MHAKYKKFHKGLEFEVAEILADFRLIFGIFDFNFGYFNRFWTKKWTLKFFWSHIIVLWLGGMRDCDWLMMICTISLS